MNTRKVLIGSSVAVAVLAGGAFAWSTVWPTAPSYAAGVVARQADWGGPGGWHRGHGGHHRRGMAMICGDRRDKRIEHGLAFVEGFVNFTPEQTTAWGELTEAAIETQQDFEALKGPPPPAEGGSQEGYTDAERKSLERAIETIQ